MSVPSNLKYTKDHEWVSIEGDIATVGITHFAQKELGDIVYVEVETLDQTLSKDEVFGTVEAVKTVNSDPYGAGWMIKVKIANPAEIEELLSDASYKELIGA